MALNEKRSRFVELLLGTVGTVSGLVGIWLSYQAISLASDLETLKMRPYMSYAFDLSTENPFLEMTNHGQFAALIKSAKYQTSTEVIDLMSESGFIDFQFLDLFPQLPDGPPALAVSLPTQPSYIGPNETWKILWLYDSVPTTAEFRASVRDLIQSIISSGTIVFEYCSIDGVTCDVLNVKISGFGSQ